ncbi:MAG: hypothetical protein M1839_007335 [Geoglossum umbratile]|nr:MAG: hypothetical protein M1839_007335 [Geoglossum umbratile]
MDSNTALVTFMLQTPSNVNSVHLVGSWDSFTKRYLMEKDVRKGKGYWKGCHTFENIICDGELDIRGRKRDGGLKMGGKYWYYYELDGEIEVHNPMQPSTNSCPFLPGQPINILDVPIETQSGRHRAQSRSDNSGLTLNPADKYTQPRPAPRPKPLRLSTSPSSLGRRPVSPWRSRSAGQSSPVSSSSASSISRHMPFSRKRSMTDSNGPKTASHSGSLRSTFLNTRGSDSESERDYGGAEKREMKIGNPVLISRSDEGRHCIPIPSLSRIASPASPASTLPGALLSPRSENPLGSNMPLSPLRSHPVLPRGDVLARSREPSPLRNPTLDLPLPPIPVEVIEEEDENDDFDLESPEREFVTPTALKPAPPRKQSFNETTPLETLIPDTEFARHPSLRPEPLHIRGRASWMDREPQSHFSIYSNSTADYSPTANTINSPTSACFSSTGDSSAPNSPHELSTPSGSEVAEEDSMDMRDVIQSPVGDNDQDFAFGALRIDTSDSKRNAACFGFSAFQGYSLPEGENGSQATLRKIATLGVVQKASRMTFGPPADGKFLQSLSESGQGLSTLEELLNDMGYLGDSIL